MSNYFFQYFVCGNRCSKTVICFLTYGSYTKVFSIVLYDLLPHSFYCGYLCYSGAFNSFTFFLLRSLS